MIIRNAHMQHYALKQFTTPAFLAVKMDDWHLNMDGGLPLHTDLVVLADGPHGPILLEHGNSLHMAVAVNSSFACESTKLIIRKYMSRTLQRVAENSTHSMRLYEFLYTMHPAGLTEVNKLSKHMAPPLNSLSVRSILPGGPTRYAAQTERVKADPSAALTCSVPSLFGPKQAQPQKPPILMARNPSQSRELRLRQVAKKCYGDDSANKFCDGVGTSDTIGIPVEESVVLQDTTAQQQRALATYRRAMSLPHRPHSHTQSIPRKVCPDSDEVPPASSSTVIASGELNTTNKAARCVSARMVRQNICGTLETATAARPRTSSSSRATSGGEGTQVCETNRQRSHLVSAAPADATAKPSQQTLAEQRAAAAGYLPIHHPRSASSRSLLTGRDSDRGQDAMESERSGGTEVRKEIVRPKSSRPYCTKSSFDQLADKEKAEKEYLGVFRDGYLTPYERERKEYAEKKDKFVAGTFKTHHGKASEMSLRQEGGVRAHGAFPAPIAYHKDNTDKLHGDWAPTTFLYPKDNEEQLAETVQRTTLRRSSSMKAFGPKKSPH